ncbi:hypothetical protein ASG87_04410 [Frateuria sp. Soil773]|uniref:alpha/beta hydrolase family protein n=1 Tax=Frateuria sp. Soil773 TaxID=1736407 RepID=UPI0006F90AC5|nr:alpha/beta fold hydrolase [Frateuria sp. Soil773]KRE89574.1 hypothetical protein ASG87_04410 [Frateuria sp. Soil773]
MNRKTVVALAAAMGLALAGIMPARAADARSEVCLANAGAMVDALARADYANAAGRFAPGGKAPGAAGLEQLWRAAGQQMGAYRRHGAPRTASLDGKPVAVVEMQYARLTQDLVMWCDGQGRLSAQRFMDPAMVAMAKYATSPHPQAPHVEADGVRVTPLDVPSPAGPLYGALTLPPGHGPFPAVVMVAGSGAQDRDESIGPNQPFRELAEGLAKQGVASLRYDKRNFDHKAWKGEYVIDAEVTDDAVAALRLLSAQKGIDPRRVFVLGHSLGAMMAPRIAMRSGQAAGLVLLAAPARPIFEVLKQQGRDQAQKHNLPPEVARKSQAVIEGEEKLLAGIAPGQPAPAGTFMGQGSHAYWLSWSRVDPVADARAAALPVLFLQGGGDFQVSPELDFGRWKQAMQGRADTAFHLYPGLSHLFMPAGKTGTVADYLAPGHVQPQVIEDIAAWVKAARPRPGGARAR